MDFFEDLRDVFSLDRFDDFAIEYGFIFAFLFYLFLSLLLLVSSPVLLIIFLFVYFNDKFADWYYNRLLEKEKQKNVGVGEENGK